MSKHAQPQAEAIKEAMDSVPPNREIFYDFDNMQEDEETGALFPKFIVNQTYGSTKQQHAVERRAVVVEMKLSRGETTETVEAEACEYGWKHFVRILWVPGYGPFSRTYIWDENH